MEQPDDLTFYSTNKINSLSQIEKNNEPKTHIVIAVEDANFVPIDPELAKRFNITENIWAHQYATKNGIHIIFTKNRAADSGYQANPADDSEDRVLYYHHEHV